MNSTEDDDIQNSSLITIQSDDTVERRRMIMFVRNEDEMVGTSHRIAPGIWRDKWRTRMSIVVLILFTVSITLTGVGIAEMLYEQNSSHGFSSNLEDDNRTKLSMSPSEAPSAIYQSDLTTLLEKSLGEEIKTSFIVDSSQWKARMWMVERDPIRSKQFLEDDETAWLMIQRYALLTIYFEFGGMQSNNIDWSTMNECQSRLILCDEKSRVLSLKLGKYGYQIDSSIFNTMAKIAS